MKNSQSQKKLQMVLFVLIAVLTLGVGYAAITAINLTINGNATATLYQNNFKVKFLEEENVTPVITSTDGGTGIINITSDTTTTFNISGLDAKGEIATANYKVKNVSEGIGTIITINLTNSNTEFFRVSTIVEDDTLQAGEETDVKVKVELLKTPIDNQVTTTVTATLTASPLENAEASGGKIKVEERPVDPYIYTINGVNDIYINTDISSWTRVYNNFLSAKAEFGHPAAIANEVENGKVKSSYVAFEKDNKVYYIKGRVGESSENVAIIKDAFGSNWESYCTNIDNNDNFISCEKDGLTVISGPHSKNSGTISYFSSGVYVGGSNWFCDVGNPGQASCYTNS